MDLRFAIRTLARTPGFTAVAILTLALGIGINTIVFTFYESVAWKPLAVRAPGEIVRLYANKDGDVNDQFSYSEYTRLRDANRSLASVVATSQPESLLAALPGAPDKSETVNVRFVSGNYFNALGVNSALGHSIEEGQPGIVISNAFWKGRLLADSSVIGKTIRIQGAIFTIAGVAPEAFAGTGVPPQSPDLWLPDSAQRAVMPNVDWIHDDAAQDWQILGRRNPGVSLATVSAELETLAAAWPSPDGKRTRLSARSASFFQPDSGEFQVFTVIAQGLMLAVLLILMIGCVNLVNLLVARGVSREREFAVRKALGAGRLRLIGQLCTESALLGVAGGTLGMLFSVWSADWIHAAIMGVLQRIGSGALNISLDLSPDWRVFSYSAALSVATGILVGLWPAVKASRTDINSALKQEGSNSSSRRAWNTRNILLTSQIAACLTLLAGAGMLFRGAWRSQDADTRFDSKHILWLEVNPESAASTDAARKDLMRRAADRLAALPEVVAVAQADRAPFLGHGSGPFQNEEHQTVGCLFNGVSEHYFDALGIPVLAGRTFTLQETENQAPVAVVSESAARAFWPGKNPLGQRLSTNGWLAHYRGAATYTVIGVVKTVRSTYLSKDDSPFLYMPKAIHAGSPLLIRTRIPPEAVKLRALAALGEIHPNLPPASTALTLEQGPLEIQRFFAEAPALVSSILGALALVLAAIGIFGTVAYLVARRTREIGIRIALGARNRDVLRLVMNQGLRAVAWGAGIGLLGALGLSALLSALVVAPDIPDLTYGAGAFNVTTFLGVLGLLGGMVLVASFIPLRRATRLEPMAALRDE